MTSHKRKAQIVTIAVLACVVGAVIVKRWRPSIAARPVVVKEETTPQDVIYAMLDAAREGDVNKYIASYTGQMETSLRQAIAESPDFSKYLKDSNAAIKGVAIAEPERTGEREVKARVEYVFQDRNEVQFMFLEKTPQGWRIARVDSAERVKTLVPYGTPVK
jgi:hypothetical protein